MKILLCSPYLQQEGIIPGGINMWAHNLLKYREEIESDVDLLPISFDRRNYVSVDTNIIKRVHLGVKEFSSAVKEAKSAMRREAVDVVHLCSSASISLTKDIIVLKAARKRNIKTVLHLHFGRIPELFKKKNWEWHLLKMAASLADTIVTMDMRSYDTLKQLKYNVVYCPNPLSVDVEKQIKQEAGNLERLPNKVVFVGHVLPSKGVFELVEAGLIQDCIELHIIGKAEEPILSELKAIANKRDDGKWVRFRGEIAHKDVIREMLSASLFAFPSYTEGFPNVILEAMACGTPIVTTRVGAIPQMLDAGTGLYGICVEPQDVTSFSKGMKAFLSDPIKAFDCANRAKMRVNEMYSSPKVWNQLVCIWKNS